MTELDEKSENGDSFPLQHEWVFWFNEKPPRGVTQDDFERSITNMGAFSTIEVGFSLPSPLSPFLLSLSLSQCVFRFCN